MNPGDVTVTCSWCDERETYHRLGPEHEAWHHVGLATQICRVESGFRLMDSMPSCGLGSIPRRCLRSI